jgi:hypothetical protein
MKMLSGKMENYRLTLSNLLALILFSSFQTASAGLNFLSSTYAVGHAPSSVTAADINGDGRLDLICANYTDNTLTILTNSGGGIFGSNATLNVGKGPASVIAADIRSSGNVDLICANFGSGGGKTLTILTNNGSGVFGSNATLTVGAGPVCVLVADLKGVGKLDLVTANQGTNGNGSTLTIMTNNGVGVFGSNETLNVGSAPVSVTAADVNGDGRVDLVSANELGNSLTVMTNRGSGRFGSNATLTVTAPTCVMAADANGDGKADLICANFNPSALTVLTNNGHGGYASEAALPLGTVMHGPIFPESVAAADLNGDGRPDLIVANTTNVAYGVGALVVFTNNAGYQLSSNATINVGIFSCCVIAADLNADGKPDLVVVNQDANTLTVLLNTNNFPPPVATPVLSLKLQSSILNASWPSASPGWSLEENSDLTKTNWLASGFNGYPIADDGTNKSLTFPFPNGNRLFRLLHP